MPPRVRIQKEDIIRAGVELVRKNGASAVNARSIAAALNCSTQPVFSNFSTMEELKLAIVDAANTLYEEYISREVAEEKYPAYKASGMAYIRFAREEKELFKLLYMRDRAGEDSPEALELNDRMHQILLDGTGLQESKAMLFHLEMWAFVHGIAAMHATGFLELDWELISRMLTDEYQGVKKRFEEE